MLQNIKILVVDDEESLCELMAEILAEQYQVFKAFNGREALKVIQEQQPNLVISDIMMPIMTGLEMLKALRQAEATRYIPVILLSAAVWPTSEILQEVTAFITKPFEIESLETLVDDTLNQKGSASTSDEVQQNFNRIHQLGEADARRALPINARQKSYKEYGGSDFSLS